PPAGGVREGRAGEGQRPRQATANDVPLPGGVGYSPRNDNGPASRSWGERAMGIRSSGLRVVGGIGVVLAVAGTTRGAEDASAFTRTVVIGKQYDAGAFHRWLWGADYRDLYATPVELPVLDLQTYAGGL